MGNIFEEHFQHVYDSPTPPPDDPRGEFDVQNNQSLGDEQRRLCLDFLEFASKHGFEGADRIPWSGGQSPLRSFYEKYSLSLRRKDSRVVSLDETPSGGVRAYAIGCYLFAKHAVDPQPYTTLNRNVFLCEDGYFRLWGGTGGGASLAHPSGWIVPVDGQEVLLHEGVNNFPSRTTTAPSLGAPGQFVISRTTPAKTKTRYVNERVQVSFPGDFDDYIADEHEFAIEQHEVTEEVSPGDTYVKFQRQSLRQILLWHTRHTGREDEDR